MKERPLRLQFRFNSQNLILNKSSFMKNLLLFLCMLCCLQASAQSFEGTIIWTVKSDPPDASGRSATGLTIKAKGTTVTTVINGGMMNEIEMWYMNNDTKIMRILRAQKMYAVVPPEAMIAAAKAVETGKFIKTTETTKILNYTCSKYTGEIKAQGLTAQVSFWTTTEIKDDQKVLSRHPDPFGNPKLPEGVDGIPLKVERISPRETSTMEVTELRLEKLSDELFKLPPDFKEFGK
jgi:hypothetical protein